jgi:hypothetical protein
MLHFTRRQLLICGFGASMANTGLAHAAELDALDKIMQSGRVIRRFGGASDNLIDAYEKASGTPFSFAYRRFLKRENGLVFSFADVDAERLGGNVVLTAMNTFFGVGNDNPGNDLLLLGPRMTFHDTAFTPFATLIGLGGDFCTYVEVNQGRFKGAIMYTDGEMFSGVRHAREKIAGRATDDIIGYFTEIGYYDQAAPDFDSLLAEYAKMA